MPFHWQWEIKRRTSLLPNEVQISLRVIVMAGEGDRDLSARLS